jgi:hypothetical protein
VTIDLRLARKLAENSEEMKSERRQDRREISMAFVDGTKHWENERTTGLQNQRVEQFTARPTQLKFLEKSGEFLHVF